MEYIKKHKLTSFIVLVYIIVVGFAYFLYKLFIGSSGYPVYGDRLDGIEDVPITEEQINKIEENILANETVIKVTKPYLKGKIFKVVITMTDNADAEATKALADIMVNELTEEQRAFYDIEVYMTKYYDCTLEASGTLDEEGNFIDKVTVKFSSDLSKNEDTLDYGLSNVAETTYNKEQKYEITEDGEFIIYGYTKDKGGDISCSIKVTKKTPEEGVTTKTETVNSITTRSFPIIGYRKAGASTFTWTKSR